MAGFGDRVRIKGTEETERLRLAGKEGEVYGWTSPSLTRVAVIGSPTDDYAINVHFESLNEAFWFSEDLVEFIDHGAGTIITLDGSDTEWVRREDGEWEERPRSS